MQQTSLQINGSVVLNSLPEGVALVDSDRKIVWANKVFLQWCHTPESVLGGSVFDALPNAHLIGPNFSPFDLAIVNSIDSTTTLETEDSALQMHVSCLQEPEGEVQFVVTLSDISSEVLQRQKLDAIHRAGAALTDLLPEEIFHMDMDARIDLLKENIEEHTQALLNVNTLEIRLLQQSTGDLISLLCIGMDDEAEHRSLVASVDNNGVTGWVAKRGQSYLCTDALCDPLYLTAFEGARSSITVPLMLHDQVIGTMNIESPEPDAFNNSDLQFLEIYARSVAQALNTFELLVAEKNNAAQQFCQLVSDAVTLPINDILNDCVHVIEEIGTTCPDSLTRLKRTLRNTRSIQKTVAKFESQTLNLTSDDEIAERERQLVGQRVLFVDPESSCCELALTMLQQKGCIVETASCGDDALLMARNCGENEPYDAIVSAIALSDYSGFQLMRRLTDLMDHVPFALMTGFGYDPGHSVVKARQSGLPQKAMLWKPFEPNTIAATVCEVLENAKAVKRGEAEAINKSRVESVEQNREGA